MTPSNVFSIRPEFLIFLFSNLPTPDFADLENKNNCILINYIYNIPSDIDIPSENNKLIIRGGLWFFLCDQTFFSTCSLNVQFFSDFIKSKQFFFSAVKLKTIFFTIYCIDSLHTMLSSQGVTTFTWTFLPCFLIRKAFVWNM